YHSEMALSSLEYILRLSVFLGFGALLFVFLKKDKKIFFWLSFFIISLLPSLTPLKIAWIVAERYAYMGAIGIFVAIAFLIHQLSLKFDNKKIPYIILAIILPLLSIRTILRNIDWKNQDNLWLAAAKTSPTSPQNHNNLGDLYARRGEFDKAVEEFKTAIALLPNYGDAYHNLANTYLQMNQLDLAIGGYLNALKHNPGLWQSHQNLAAIYAHQGHFDLARKHLNQALEIVPNNESLKTALQKLP
ncbi:MAG: tetratricopeptide repeat protein, partial [Patescibacteria group bacterium]